jgi:hypothetical protein
MEILIFWIAGMIITGILASRRGRNVFGWVVLAFFVSPLISLLLLVVLPRKRMSDSDQLIFDSMSDEQKERIIAAVAARTAARKECRS